MPSHWRQDNVGTGIKLAQVKILQTSVPSLDTPVAAIAYSFTLLLASTSPLPTVFYCIASREGRLLPACPRSH